MKKQTVFKKLLSSIIVAVIVLGQFSSYRLISEAATIDGGDGPIYLSLSRTNKDEENSIGYGFGVDTDGSKGRIIWNIMKADDSNGTGEVASSNIYCIRAEHGATWNTNSTPSKWIEYNKNYEVPLQQGTASIVANNVLFGEAEYKNEILWIIDHLYVAGESDFDKYLNAAEIYYDDYDGGYCYIGTNENYSSRPFEETVTEDDIVAVQQAAIWYFTNGGEYDKRGSSRWLQYTTEELLQDGNATNKYPQLASEHEGRDVHATVIYNYLIDQAIEQTKTLNENNEEYQLKYSTAKLWLSTSEGADNDEQPVIEVHKKEFDLSLRKTIAEVKDSEGNPKGIVNSAGNDATRVVTVDETPLISEETGIANTTANYKHRKDPVVVETGDTVKYAITIYNECQIDGYANIIKDQLPGTWGSGLRLQTNSGTVTSTTGNIYTVQYDTTNNIVILTMAENSPKNVIPAYDGEGDPESETVYIECKVMGNPDAKNQKVLTNIAYIAEEYNAENDTIEDRDSYVDKFPQYSGNVLITDDIGYTGKDTNLTDSASLSSNETYYEGQEDDDDFEKVVILPESFDLSLRKNITKINGENVETRTPVPNAETLKNGDTTAEYNHRKDAVTVKTDDIVEYNITIYNEGSIDGVASIIKDQLPTGLKFDLDQFTKEGDEYIATSSKGNKYKVTYDETNNVVTFTLKETEIANIKLLNAYTNGDTLDQDVITLQCVVDCIADDEENIYLTNIAYIYTAIRYDGTDNGTIVTNQKAGTENGSEADRDSEPYTYPNEKAKDLKTVGNIGYIGDAKVNSNKDLSQNVYFRGEQDDDDFEKLVIAPKCFDLKLIKFITDVNDETTGNRVISVDTSKLNTTNAETTADYILEKNPVSVKAGDFVTYTLRVYNEGNYDGYATEISENIPKGLEFIVIGDGTIWSWDGETLKDITEEIQDSDMYDKIVDINSNWGYSKDSSIITTSALSEDLIKAFGKENVEYADVENKIDYKEIQVIFRVKEDVEPNVTIRNEAAISQDKAVDDNGEEIDISDRDSKPEEWNKENSEETYDEEGKWPIYKEDDEDYDNIITKAFDLSLRKQIIKINDALYTNRYATLLDSKEEQETTKTLYDYYNVYSNKPKVKAGDKVTYSIRVYNEGDIDGYASLIVDTLPSGLEFVEYEPGDGSINEQYGWILVEGTENVYQTDYLSYEKDVNKGTSKSTILKAYDGDGEAAYQEIYIECRVKTDATKEDSLLNVAQIAEDSDSKGEPIKDKDSVPGTSDDESKWKDEDDLDIEILELQEFDLALRKFITQIENGEEIEEVTTRIPEVSYDKETKQLVYTHPKDALVVHVGDTVIYTLRVYNEGDIDGYAAEIKDDIPEYLEYLPEHETNIEYQWVMYDEEGNETEDTTKAVFIKTKHLAKGWGIEEEDSEGSNLIKAFNPETELSDTNPDYKEVKVAFKVKDPNSTEYEIVNFAQISEDTDSKGDPIDDRDSEPDNGEDDPKEDDEDIEKVKVEYFDLSLLKYVTKVLVNENGQERVIETGNIGDENDIIPHVQINKKNIDKTVVKFVYTIQITNEGQIAGEATEITDYVPKGLLFVAEDNEFWTDEGNNVISTRQLTGTTLQPGETAQVEVVLRWINGADNLGEKTNVAEISEDYNEENIPDRDSTPDNKKDGEDDIDDATVLLSVNQGGGIQSIYINLSLTFLVIILVGGILIKKFVL